MSQPTASPARVAPAPEPARGGLRSWSPGPRLLRAATGATATSLGLIVVTGGGVRLSDSGLGCPTWPRCVNSQVGSFANIHASIEFGNRLVTVAVTILIGVTTVLTFRTRERRPDLRTLSVALVLGVLGDAVIGGLTVRFHLPPLLVAVHFLFSMLLLAIGLLLHRNAGRAAPSAGIPVVTAAPAVLWISRALVVSAGLVLCVGTLVTGTGPHSGGGHHPRLGLGLARISQAHADTAMLLTGLVLAGFIVSRATTVPAAWRRRIGWLTLAVAGQATIGWIQYAEGLPAALVLVHVAGATLVWTLAVATLLACRAQQVTAAG
jgi:cytochrome c oxidase assembly protein subunit 15